MTTAHERPVRAVVGQVVGSSRPLSWVNTAYPFAAAFVLAGGLAGGGTAAVTTFVVGTVYFLVPYNLLMYGLNDVWDYESDLRNPRKGGVEGVVLDRRWHRTTVWSAVLSNLPFLAYLVAVGDGASTAVLALSVFAVVAYSAPVLRFKERPVLDSATSATHFVSPAVFGLALAGGSVTTPVLAALAAFFLWSMASQAFGAVQDVAADRAAGIGSVATWLGAARTVRAAMVTYVVAGVVVLGTGWPTALAALLVMPYVLSIAPYRNLEDVDCELAHPGWRRFLWLNLVTGFLVTQLLIVRSLLG